MASDWALQHRNAANQATARWTRGLLSALRGAGCEIRACSHCHEQSWPKGELWPGSDRDFDADYPVRFTRFLNLPELRFAWLSAAYRKMVAEEIKALRPDVVLAYNLAPYHCAVSEVVQRLGIPWVPIVLDHPDPVQDHWEAFRHRTKGSRGVVYVSDWGFKQTPLQLPKLHLDGGVVQVAATRMTPSSGHRRIVYSGKYNHDYGGMDFLFKMFATVKRSDCELLLTGKEVHGQLRPYLQQEPRARHLGYLSREALNQVYADAAVFVNPNSPDSPGNRMNFPSKLLDYLPYGKPIVSTWTGGMAEVYRDLLTCPTESTPQAYGVALESMLDLSGEAGQALQSKILRWCEGHTWACQAQRLLAWLGEL
jgi:glycosyltransferase involved in cell wall biosynthesis